MQAITSYIGPWAWESLIRLIQDRFVRTGFGYRFAATLGVAAVGKGHAVATLNHMAILPVPFAAAVLPAVRRDHHSRGMIR
jgi:hypothetical protein